MVERERLFPPIKVKNESVFPPVEEFRYGSEVCATCRVVKCELIKKEIEDDYEKLKKRGIVYGSKVHVKGPRCVVIDDEVANDFEKEDGNSSYQSQSTNEQEESADSNEARIYKIPYDARDILYWSCPFSGYNYIEECGSEKVSDGIGDHYKVDINWCPNAIETRTKNRWEPGQPVFISAQTGQGKNFFIENKLIPYVRELNRKNNTNQRVLIISNRLALKRQVKNRIEGNVDNDGSELIYNYNEFVDVITYQSIIYLRNKFKITQKKKNAAHRYIYVICDEAHFFSSDAMFNPNTERILFIILEVFQSAIRVYMSATPYECIHTIREYEEEWQYRWDPYDKKPYDTMISYHFQRNYDYLNLKAYSNIKELI